MSRWQNRVKGGLEIIFTEVYCVTEQTRAHLTSEICTTSYGVKTNLDLTDNLDVENVSRSDNIVISGDDNVTSSSDYRGRQLDFRRRLSGTTTWLPAAIFEGQQRDFTAHWLRTLTILLVIIIIASGAVVAHKNNSYSHDNIATYVGAFHVYLRVVGTVPAMTPVHSVKQTCLFRLVAGLL